MKAEMNQQPFQQSFPLSPPSQLTFTVYATGVKVIGWIGIAFFLFCAVASYLAGQEEVSPFFLCFVAMGIYLILATGQLSMNSEEIIYMTPLAKYQMKWGEVEAVEMDLKRGSLVFYSDNRNKCLAVLGPHYWSGDEKYAMSRFLSKEMEKHQIKPKVTAKAAFKMSKNSKVK